MEHTRTLKWCFVFSSLELSATLQQFEAVCTPSQRPHAPALTSQLRSPNLSAQVQHARAGRVIVCRLAPLSNRLIPNGRHKTLRCIGNLVSIMATTANTGRSIKAATTSLEVYSALVSHITDANAIVSVGDRVAGVKITRRPLFYLQTNGKEKATGRTNKFLASIKQATLDARAHLLSLPVAEARELAYAIQDANTVVLPIWEDDSNKDRLMNGRPFSAVVRQRSYTAKDGSEKTESYFFDVEMEALVSVKGQTASKDEFMTGLEIVDPVAAAAAAAAKAATPPVNAELG